MDERVWEKTAQFLKELRCEDTGRLSAKREGTRANIIIVEPIVFISSYLLFLYKYDLRYEDTQCVLSFWGNNVRDSL